MNTGNSVAIFASGYWKTSLANKEIVKVLAESGWKVIFIETIGARRIRNSFHLLFDLILNRSRIKQISYVEAGLDVEVLRLRLLKGHYNKCIRIINDWIIRRNKYYFNAYDLIIISMPTVAYYSKMYSGCNNIIFYSVDDFESFSFVDKKKMAKLYEKLIDECNKTAFSSLSQYNKYKKNSDDSRLSYVNHGVSHEFKNIKLNSSTSRKFVYFGTVDERLDFELLSRISEYYPVHLIGNRRRKYAEPDCGRNLVYMNPMSRLEFIEWLDEGVILLLPYIVNDFSKYMNPIKLHEYMCLKLPIISTNIEAISEYKEFLSTIDGNVDIEHVIAEAELKCHKYLEYRSRYASHNSWETRVQNLLQL
jgi:teichuronic acid biosynthesis glycosyltransferase TuaH